VYHRDTKLLFGDRWQVVETSDYHKFDELERPMSVAELNLLFFLLVDEEELDGDWKEQFGWEKGWVDPGRDEA